MNTLNQAMLLEGAAIKVPEKIFIQEGTQELTYQQINIQAQCFANVLVELGVKKGDKVACLLPNVAFFSAFYYGVLKVGAVVVPLNVNTRAKELTSFLDDSGAVVLVVWESVIKEALSGFAEASGCHHLLMANYPESDLCPQPAKSVKQLMSKADNYFDTSLTKPEDSAIILYTSGTTGRPKGVVLTHYNCFFFSQSFTRELCQLNCDDVMLMIPPISHMFGQILINMACFAQAKLIMVPKFETELFLKTVEKEQVTFSAGVPTMGSKLVNSSLVSQYDVSSLKSFMFGGATLHPELANKFASDFQVQLSIAYGLTETLPVTFSYYNQTTPAGTVGKATVGTQIRIVNPENYQDVMIGEEGEVWVRGPHLFKEYYQQPEATTKTFYDGWFRTGDLGKLDNNGYLFILDRLKDVIKTSGYLVVPNEVERVLYDHPDVAEVAVVGVPHQTLGEIIKAFVALKPNRSVKAKELITHCKNNLASYKCPLSIIMKDELPKSASGKILRRALRNNS